MSTYNGWKNYETWNVALWIDNDQGTYNERCRIVAECIEDAPSMEQVPRVWTSQQAARYSLADRLKDWVESDMIPDLGSSMAADLLAAALSEVDWEEIAENWLDDEDGYKALGEEREVTP
jgi:hypothetical protein